MSAVIAIRCRNHGHAAIIDSGIAVARKIIQIKMAHHAMHVIGVKSGVSVHGLLDVLVFRSEPLNTNVLACGQI